MIDSISLIPAELHALIGEEFRELSGAMWRKYLNETERTAITQQPPSSDLARWLETFAIECDAAELKGYAENSGTKARAIIYERHWRNLTTLDARQKLAAAFELVGDPAIWRTWPTHVPTSRVLVRDLYLIWREFPKGFVSAEVNLATA